MTALPEASGENPRRPNVVLLICDQMQQQRLGAGWALNGTPGSLTPNLDLLAAEGTSFNRAYCSNAQCTPSRASLQTGQYPHESGVMVIYGFGGHTGHLGPRHTTLAHAFKAAGYATAIFGKTHFGYPIEELGFDSGIERGGGESLAAVDRQITDDAIGFLAGHPAEKPLFLVVSWHQPHPPFEEAEPFFAGMNPQRLDLPHSFFGDDLAGKPRFQRDRRRQQGGGYDEEQLRSEMAKYCSMISAVDHEAGRVIAAVKSSGSWDHTIAAFTSDHGDMMGAHGLRLKGPLPYEELFRVPLIIRAPHLPGNRVVDELNVNVQLPGTLMDLAGVPRPDSWPDREALAGLEGDDDGPDQVFMEHYGAYWGWHPFRMVVTKTHKYVRYYGPDDGEEELYHLAVDPGECVNLAQNPEHGAIRARLRNAVDDWWHETGGQEWAYYESDDFKLADEATLVRDNHLWADT
jgi:arylsulfatase